MLPSPDTGRLLGIPLRALVMLAIGAVFAWNASLRWQMLFQHRTELGGVEHNVVHGIQKVMLGHTLYEDPEQPPFDVIQYTPAYYVLCAGIGKLMGLHGDDARAIFLLSRSVALALWLLTGLLVYRACRMAGAVSWSAALAAGITLCTAWEQSFSRMDALAEATTAGVVLLFIRWLVSGEQRALILASVVAVLGVFAKQSGVVMVAAPVLYLLLARQWKPLRIVLITMSIASVAGFGATLLLGTPLAIYQNTVLGLRNGFSWMMYTELFNPPTYKYFIGWHILAAIVVLRGLRSPHAPLRFLALAIPLSLGFALITGLKYGSRLNYLHESLMLTFMGIAILLPQTKPAWRNMIGWSLALYGLLFASFRTNSVMAWHRVGDPDAIHAKHLDDDIAVRDALVHDLGLKPDEYVFITYREYLEHFFVGQSLLTQKDIVQYSRDRLFDYTDFHRAMTDGTVRFVITDGATGPITYMDSTYAGWEPLRKVRGRIILARDARP
ncbi:MAG: hypothetical protein KF797_11630 [Flavobacteriales bacterium]|nr:hypothetical protein [Flavobacteriales bacterium]